MTRRRRLLALGALGSAVSLSGCVAAVIPLAAGALMATSTKIDGNGGRDVGRDGNGDVARVATAENPRQASFDEAFEPETATEFVAGPLPGPADSAPLAGDPGESARAQLSAIRDAAATRMSGGATFRPGPLPAPSAGSDSVVEGFLAHALDQTQRNPTLTPRQSALLAEPGELRPERMDCGNRAPAVIVDLDPGKDSFDPLAPVAGNPRLAEALAELREREVTVFWTSHLGEGFEDSVRGVLAETGLDPQGLDRLVLLRSLDQRKHTRRTEIAQTHCVVAMMGDERADFDELFHYLRRPDTALRLDAMLGSGWFLADPLPAQIIGDE
ncbi:hypothetical protein A9995_04145 [Erythrobacter sp. QSSC1-22B]|uniref:hypothetical protein n=1 Tax=Erythrobacter sp. QSSC1-22B TaxID=1860125 RepID=UPI000804EA71|nr:hypothetical protein [Erythrobacter sp. QSSC1-22B]OBX19762.1 hypothetical protein A9995_04145 [Erythrobacter sp. QSSC1-22B]